MKTVLKLAALLGCLAPLGAAVAETLVVDDQVQVRQSSVERPARGATMSAVEQKFGAPSQKHAAVGGCSANVSPCKTPPITRWDYPGFSVIFENEYVIEAVVTGG
ncbi:MAG TPA: hypothetical protein VG994_19615 [Steroidobacteraceae bacterium]|nr:hypothetical protein [Steroidobacteraceae bacterium]